MQSELHIKYNLSSVADELVNAKTVILSLKEIPYYRGWTDRLQQMELRREIQGTTRIGGAVFTEREYDEAIKDSALQLSTRSQRQVRAVWKTYKWISTVHDDRSISIDLIQDMHRKIIVGADDDRCPPGIFRTRDQEVVFGQPPQKGVEGGIKCLRALTTMCNVLQWEYRDHDPMIMALAAHYHFMAIHPFLVGNGRMARALGALMLQRAGLRSTCFIAMSNYYHDEKTEYLEALAEVKTANDDLTPFLKFGLRGIAQQSKRLMNEIKLQLQKALFRDLMRDLFGRFRTPHKKVIAQRQMAIMNLLLDEEILCLDEIFTRVESYYVSLRVPMKALLRDLSGLHMLGTINVKVKGGDVYIEPRLEWPTRVNDTEFFKIARKLPKIKNLIFAQAIRSITK